MTNNESRHAERPFRVLIIEDDAEVSRLMCLCLQKDGIECFIANNGPSGLSLHDEKQPHLVLLDWMLPGMSGQEVLDALRLKTEVPVLIVSALADESTEGNWRGADGQIGKPFSPARLNQRVHQHLREYYEE
jgi:DNA-binding response OmpR family regulator